MKGRTAWLLLATTLGLAACGGDGDNRATPPVVTPPVTPPALKAIRLVEQGRYKTNRFQNDAGGAAEIPAYDIGSQRVFVVNAQEKTVDVLSLANPAMPVKVGTLNLASLGDSPNSVAALNGMVAVAVQAAVKTNPGRVGLFRASDLTLISSAEVGALPDMLTFTADGRTVLVANEGEPNSYGQADSVDPEGSVSLVDFTNLAAPVVRTAGFAAFNDQAAALRAQGVRLFGTNASVAQDLEPEYIALHPDGRSAMVSLQEANALAKLDIASATITAILPLGLKDHSRMGQGLDPSDRDTAVNAGINIATWPVRGLYQPDTLASLSIGGKAYFLTANEGDARDYTGLAEEVRVGASSYVLDATVFPDAATLKGAANLGRLTVSNRSGDTDGDGDFDQIHVFGARSFSILDDTGAFVFDSGDDIERRIAALSASVRFNPNSTSNTQDDRSDNKGPEPEAVTAFTIEGRSFAVVGLERQGGLMVYDITTPATPVFVEYVSNRKFMAASLQTDVETNGAADGDLAPEGIVYVPAASAPGGVALLIVASEGSGTTTIYAVQPVF